MLAAAVDMEPGVFFRACPSDPPLEWLGVESVVSRFPGKHRVRVLVGRGGRSFVCDAATRFQVIEFGERP
jgi:hypothetical protein